MDGAAPKPDVTSHMSHVRSAISSSVIRHFPRCLPFALRPLRFAPCSLRFAFSVSAFRFAPCSLLPAPRFNDLTIQRFNPSTFVTPLTSHLGTTTLN